MVAKGQADYSAICNFVRINNGAIVKLREGLRRRRLWLYFGHYKDKRCRTRFRSH